MTTTEKTPVLDESNDDVFYDDSSSSSEEGRTVLDYCHLPASTALKAADVRRPSSRCSLARASAPPPRRRPASLRRRVRTCFTTGAVLTAVLLERTSYFSIVGNLVLFCTNGLGLSSTFGVTIDLVFIGKLIMNTPVHTHTYTRVSGLMDSFIHFYAGRV